LTSQHEEVTSTGKNAAPVTKRHTFDLTSHHLPKKHRYKVKYNLFHRYISAIMTAMKIIHDLLPSALRREAPRAKRRKTQSLPCSGMEVEGSDQHQHLQNNINEIMSTAPSLLITRSLADHGMPDRLDPFSMDYLMDFDYDDGSRHYDIPTDILMTIQFGNADQLTQHYGSRDRLMAQRNSQGETLLHLACRLGSVAIIKSLLCDIKVSAFVLDKQGRSPLHSLCLVMNSSSMDGTTSSRNCNHFESLQLLLQEKATLILYKDKHGKVPFEYIQQFNDATNNNALLLKSVNEMLCSERIVKRVVEEMSDQVEKSRSGQRMTAWEKINSMIDFSGLDSAIMEAGLSV